MTNHALIGRNWYRRPAQRFWSLSFVEHAETNIHFHALLAKPVDVGEDMFCAAVEASWLKLVESGSVDLQPIGDRRGIAHYVTKDLWNSWTLDSFQPFGPTNG